MTISRETEPSDEFDESCEWVYLKSVLNDKKLVLEPLRDRLNGDHPSRASLSLEKGGHGLHS